MNNGLGRWNFLIFKCFRFSDGGIGWDRGRGSNLSVFLEGEGQVEMGRGGGGWKKSVDPIIFSGPRFSPPLLF